MSDFAKKFTALLLLLPTLATGALEIRIPTGRILGQDKLSYITQRPYYVYYGIPFAEPPIGRLRFQEPQPFTYEATRLLTDQDVLVVTIQYRLGVFGFASTLDDAQPGNNGLLDQIVALQWIKDYIGQFGGDPTDVTIFGESAGAASVSLLSISPLAKGLFTKFTALLLLLPTLASGTPEIRIPTGRILGQDKLSYITQRPYYVYYGIPFAEPPIGRLRFQEPQPFVGTGPDVIISSNSYRPACMQAQYSGIMDEDCLHLNIFVPQGGTTIKKVLVWIHGGAFVIGDAKTYEATRLLTDQDVLVVTIQYRLGVFGFASTLDDAQPGNNGLLDQIVALQWIKDYIGQFGGDPTGVTIFGESAGAASVSLLSISPLAKGLFTKGIMQSGTALSPFSNIKKPAELVYRLSKSLGCMPSYYFPGFSVQYHQRIMQCLREKPAAQINMPASFQDDEVTLDIGTLIDHGPVVDGKVIPRNPFDLMLDKGYLRAVGALDRSYIVGANNAEGISTLDYLVFAAGGSIETVTQPDIISQYVKSISQSVMPFPLNNDHLNLIDFIYTYPRDEQGKIPVEVLVVHVACQATIIDMTTDTNFVVPSVQFAKFITEASDKAHVFLYLFDHFPEVKDPTSPLRGTNHGHDVLFEFDLTPSLRADNMNNYIVVGTPTNSPLYQIFGWAVATFAKTGVPVSSLQGSGGQLEWPNFDPQQEKFIAISLNPEVRNHVYDQRVSLWLDFLPRMQFYKGNSRVAFMK
ncbi:carboxylic ester hydrolase [Plakobranchus ocellatus]|uniref:Carboxylic ester hydrolase n=1 Tax=Plakobranchus ocellatus TaxID=259542 RepID=A0AAV4DDH4_9GAST|nr:carboxylic ester hydrolase [Plakobranchus ocellatus]